MLSCAPRTEHLVSQLYDCPLMGLLKISAFRVPGVNAWAREKQFKLGHYLGVR